MVVWVSLANLMFLLSETMVKYKKLKMQQTPVNLKLGPNEKVPEVDSMRSPIPYKREVKVFKFKKRLYGTFEN